LDNSNGWGWRSYASDRPAPVLILTGSNDMAVFAIIATDGTVAPGLLCLVNELGVAPAPGAADGKDARARDLRACGWWRVRGGPWRGPGPDQHSRLSGFRHSIGVGRGLRVRRFGVGLQVGVVAQPLEYLLYPTQQATVAEAAETLKTAAEIIGSATKILPNLGFF
jgi:hypothetical protein